MDDIIDVDNNLIRNLMQLTKLSFKATLFYLGLILGLIPHPHAAHRPSPYLWARDIIVNITPHHVIRETRHHPAPPSIIS